VSRARSARPKSRLGQFQDKLVGWAGEMIAGKPPTKRQVLKAAPALFAVVATACGVTADSGSLARPIDTETPSPTATKVFTPTTEASPTPEITSTPEAVDEWRLSPDGHIYYNEALLYGGLFTINPENTTAYWEDLVTGLYAITLYLGNTRFLSRYPTEGSFLEAIGNGRLIEGLCIPAQHPSRLRQWAGVIACSSSEPVNLSSVSIVIDRPTREEMLHHSPYDFPPYLFFDGKVGELYVEVIEREGNRILEFHFRRDLIYEEPYMRPLLPDGSPEYNLVVATELLNSWNFVIGLLPERPTRESVYLIGELDPPALFPTFTSTWIPTYHSSLSETDSSLIMLR
jgi:hypothetical protein